MLASLKKKLYDSIKPTAPLDCNSFMEKQFCMNLMAPGPTVHLEDVSVKMEIGFVNKNDFICQNYGPLHPALKTIDKLSTL